MDLAFEQMLAQHNQEFKEAEVFDNWKPPVGSYIVSISKVDCGHGTKNDPNLGWWRVTCKIEAETNPTILGTLVGREFSEFYSTKAFGALKGAARILSNNGGLNDLTEAHEALQASLGLVVRVEILITTAKNNKDYKNCYFREIIDTETVASAEEQVPNPGQVIGAMAVVNPVLDVDFKTPKVQELPE